MTMKIAVLTLALLAGAVVAPAQQKSSGKGPDSAWLQQVWDAWNTMDPANAAKYYDQSPENVYFDIAPLQYKGWTAYAAGAKQVLATFQALNCKVEEPAIHGQGSWAWGTSLVNCDTVAKDGSKSPMKLRYSGVFRKQGGNWLIVHEQISAPLP